MVSILYLLKIESKKKLTQAIHVLLVQGYYSLQLNIFSVIKFKNL